MTISPAQRAREADRASFFGLAPTLGPALPNAGSNIRESPAQVARREFKEGFFQPKTMRESSVRKVADAFTTNETPRSREASVTGGKTKNEAKGAGGGFLIFQDCEGTETGRLGQDQGIFISEDLTIQAGCSGGSSYPV